MDISRASAAHRLLRWRPTAVRPGNWVCQFCERPRFAATRRFATKLPTTPKPYYVTTPIFYVNAAPHVGHMYSMVLADVLKRWQTLTGQSALLCTGTDEHGIKVQQAASLQDLPPKQFCDENSAKFEHLAQRARISYDRFIRTTDEDHIAAVEHFWFLLREKGLIYESKHSGWYCVSDECFYPESQVQKKLDVYTGQVRVASIESGNKVEWIEERNYHFRMTALKDRLLDFYANNPDWVVPHARMRQVVDWVENSLEDLSISRPAERLDWGIRVPGDSSQTIYVWVDALVNYITTAGFPTWTPGREHEGGWPADVHVIGKDILRFHCVYWPALLLALDLPLPKQVLSHAHWTMDQRKMSKSLGNVVNPMFAIERWGIDAIRFYMVYNGGIAEDSDYNNDVLAAEYKKLLQSGIGNLAGRVLRPSTWNARSIIQSVGEDGLSTGSNRQMDELFSEHLNLLKSLTTSVDHDMKMLNPSAALHKVIDAAMKTNKFITNTQPWSLVNKDDAESKRCLIQTVFLASETLRLLGILLQPFMPDKASELLDMLGVAECRRRLEDAVPLNDFGYGTPFQSAPKAGVWAGLFPPLNLRHAPLVPNRRA